MEEVDGYRVEEGGVRLERKPGCQIKSFIKFNWPGKSLRAGQTLDMRKKTTFSSFLLNIFTQIKLLPVR